MTPPGVDWGIEHEGEVLAILVLGIVVSTRQVSIWVEVLVLLGGSQDFFLFEDPFMHVVHAPYSSALQPR